MKTDGSAEERHSFDIYASREPQPTTKCRSSERRDYAIKRAERFLSRMSGNELRMTAKRSCEANAAIMR